MPHACHLIILVTITQYVKVFLVVGCPKMGTVLQMWWQSAAGRGIITWHAQQVALLLRQTRMWLIFFWLKGTLLHFYLDLVLPSANV